MGTDHFKGKYEVELKYRLACRQEFLTRLQTIPHEVMFEDNLELDSYFDTPQRTLTAEGKLLCIRELEPSGVKIWYVKGPEADRCEATNIVDADAARSMLLNMGYQQIATATKIRSVYFVGKFHLTLDKLEGIGEFAEFAVMTDDEQAIPTLRAELEKLASLFGLFDRHLEHKSYRQLMQIVL